MNAIAPGPELLDLDEQQARARFYVAAAHLLMGPPASVALEADLMALDREAGPASDDEPLELLAARLGPGAAQREYVALVARGPAGALRTCGRADVTCECAYAAASAHARGPIPDVAVLAGLAELHVRLTANGGHRSVWIFELQRDFLSRCMRCVRTVAATLDAEGGPLYSALGRRLARRLDRDAALFALPPDSAR